MQRKLVSRNELVRIVNERMQQLPNGKDCLLGGVLRLPRPDKVEEQQWEVDVFVEEGGDRRISSVTVEADSEAEAVRRAIAEFSRALMFLSPVAKVVGARARRKV